MLLRITENKIQDFDFSKPLSITSKIYQNEKFSRIMLILTYGKYNTILYSCTTISNDAAKMLMDFLSFVGKQTVIRIFDTASKGERLINLVSVIDDIIKNAEEAYNENTKAKHWDWFTNTMLSRLEEGGKIIIIMTRWASDDLAGRAIEHFGDKAKVITMKALQDDGTMLCDDVLSYESYKEKCRAMGENIASANYQQIPIDLKGCLYSNLKTYEHIPTGADGSPLFTQIKNYTDTADTG